MRCDMLGPRLTLALLALRETNRGIGQLVTDPRACWATASSGNRHISAVAMMQKICLTCVPVSVVPLVPVLSVVSALWFAVMLCF
jgi:hypothetical protein